MNAIGTESTIVKEITIQAPAAKVFAALTEPDQLTQWWGEEGRYQTEHMEADLRVGGRWRTTGMTGSGQRFAVEGVYRAIDPPCLLEFTWRHDWGDAPEAETLVRFELTEHDGATLLRLTHSGFTNRESRDDHDDGWTTVLDWLRSYVEDSKA